MFFCNIKNTIEPKVVENNFNSLFVIDQLVVFIRSDSLYHHHFYVDLDLDLGQSKTR